MKVLVTEKLDPGALERLKQAGLDVSVQLGLQGDALAAALHDCQALIVRGATKVTAAVLKPNPGLRAVARAGTGVDNIDVAEAQRMGIRVLNAPAANATSVAELVFALLLAFERHVAGAASDLAAGRWEKSKYAAGRELAGRRIGLLGFGRIGRGVALRARAFEMEVWAHDPLLEIWPAEFGWVRNAALDALLPAVDYLSLHLPLLPETRGRIGARELALMRPDAVLVNCARGGIVDEPALHAALVGGTLRGAALDVFATEPAPADHPLLSLPNVIATPHLGASTAEAQARAGIEAAERVIETLAGSGQPTT